MFSNQNSLLSQKSVSTFTLPRLHKGKRWYVDFTAYDPKSDGLRRKKYMLGKYKTVHEREDAATILLSNIYAKLVAGWNPFINCKKSRQFREFSATVEQYVAYIDMAMEKKILKQKTGLDYKSRLKQLLNYIEDAHVSIKYVYQFDKNIVVDFLDYLVLDQEVSARTRNNYRVWLSTFFTWLIDRQYVDKNPIEEIRTLKETEKVRDPITPENLRLISEYTKQQNPQFYLACLMEYYTFIRPNELRYIKIGDISIKDQTIFVSADVSKNRKGQYVSLNNILIKEMIDQGVFSHPSTDYLFGKGLFPGREQLRANYIREVWASLRKKLNLPQSYQFYSLKDSGIRDLANAKGIVVARDQARHYDISVTNKYLKAQGAQNSESKDFVGKM